MSLAPLLTASPVVQLHVMAALSALGVGIAQFLGPKGRRAHRVLGFVWIGLMATVALSSFGIAGRGHLSWIHGLSAFTLVMLPLAWIAARRHRVETHRQAMLMLFLGALVIAGAFTLLPGRIMGKVVFGW
jgi:uncharacterized membrane protein